MHRTIRRLAAAALVATALIGVGGCTAATHPPAPPASTGIGPLPEIPLPNSEPSCVFHGLSFGYRNLAVNPVGAEDVKVSIAWVQQWLGSLPADEGGAPALRRTGYFDRDTDAAVRRFQTVARITPVDGLVGDATWPTLGLAVEHRRCRVETAPSCDFVGLAIGIGNVDPRDNPIGAEDVREDVRVLQALWNSIPAKERGERPDLTLRTTGSFDADTDVAVVAFQKASDGRIAVDSWVGPDTWRALATAAGACKGEPQRA